MLPLLRLNALQSNRLCSLQPCSVQFSLFCPALPSSSVLLSWPLLHHRCTANPVILVSLFSLFSCSCSLSLVCSSCSKVICSADFSLSFFFDGFHQLSERCSIEYDNDHCSRWPLVIVGSDCSSLIQYLNSASFCLAFFLFLFLLINW